MISLTTRQKDIIKYIAAIDDYVKIKSISEVFGVSERTVRYDLDMINHCLKNMGFELIRKPNLGIRIPNVTGRSEKLETIISDLNHSVFSAEERAFLISIYLIASAESTTIEELSSKLMVSKNTILSDLSHVENKLIDYGLGLKRKTHYGLAITGEEENIRNSFSRLYYEGIRKNLITRDFIKELLHYEEFEVQSIISCMEEKMNMFYSDLSKDELEIFILHSIIRAKGKNYIYYSDELKSKYIHKKEYKALNILFNEHDKYSFLNDSDVCYITKMFMGAKIINHIECMENSIEDEESKIIAKQIIQDAEEYLGIDFSDDYEFINGLALHLKVAFHRLRNNLLIENPLTEQIKYRIAFIYGITTKILAKYERMLEITFPDAEIAFVAMYLGAAFEKKTQSGFMPKVLVVCGSGIATSGILSTRLSIMLPELKLIGPVTLDSVTEELMKNRIDFLISTVDLKVDGYEVVKVNPLLDVSDIEQIKNLIYKNTYKKQCDYLIKRYDIHQNNKVLIQELISRDDVKFNIKTKDWREAVKIASKSLVDKKFIDNNYVLSIIKAVEKLGPYMVFIPGIAFTHAAPECGVKEECISLITLEDELDFGDNRSEKIKILAVFAAKDEKSNVLTRFVSILENDDNILKIKNASDYDEIRKLSN